MKLTYELVTIQRAQEFLTTSVPNRKYRKNVGQDIGYQMKHGQWLEETGETLKFNKQGQFFDGQHRMMGFLASGLESMNFAIAWDCDDEAFKKIDTGTKRTAGDILHVEGIKSAYQLSGMIRSYLILKSGRVYANKASGVGYGIHNYDLLNEYQFRPNFWQQANAHVNGWYHSFAKIIPPSAWGGFYAHFYAKDKQKAFSFMEDLAHGENLRKGSPILQLRNLLINNKESRNKLMAADKGAYFIKAWNMYRKEEIGKLEYDHNEKYPKIL